MGSGQGCGSNQNCGQGTGQGRARDPEKAAARAGEKARGGVIVKARVNKIESIAAFICNAVLS